MFKVVKVLKTKNKDLKTFEDMADLKCFLKEEFGNHVLQKPYIRNHLYIKQNVKKGYFVIKETYKNIIVSPSDDLFLYLIN